MKLPGYAGTSNVRFVDLPARPSNSASNRASHASFILRTCRQLIPNISAASIQLIVFAYALNIIWFLFVARSIAFPTASFIADLFGVS